MIFINVVLSYMVGGALVGMQRLAHALPQYKWMYTKIPHADADIVLYMNDHNHYLKAKKLGIKHIVQRKTGVRSLSVPEPEDLSALVCGSLKSFNKSKHPRKTLIYNGIDLDYVKEIKPINTDLLVCEQRIGRGQQIEKSIAYALSHKRRLTILGNGDGIANDRTYVNIKNKYPEFIYPGRVSPNEALAYIKGCRGIIIANPSHGVANQVIEALVCDKLIINLGGVEIPPKDQLDIKLTAEKYDKLFTEIIKERI